MNQVLNFLVSAWSKIGTPLSEQAIKLAREGEWAQLQELSLRDPRSYASAGEYHRDVLVTELFRKCILPSDKARLRRNAVTTFLDCEVMNKVTNDRLTRYLPETHYLTSSAQVAVDDFINRWRKEVSRVLRKASYVLEPRFSPGATVSDHSGLVTIPDKMTSEPTSYSSSLRYFDDYFHHTPQWERWSKPRSVRANVFFTVPKDTKKDRGCCKEASVNVALQLAVGAAMKRCYEKSYGYSIASRALRHQRLARLASADRRALATIDLSNASDSVCYNLVKLVLPKDWFELLNSLRATHTNVYGKIHRLEKFSSMGNGFTFELETILYQTLCDTVIGERASSSFGDDMIVPAHKAADVISALKFFGFTPNEKKTFCDGPFRESCGGDYFNGIPVRGHYLKELPYEPQQWIALANGLRRADPGLYYYADAWSYCRKQVPSEIRRCLGPGWLGDLVFQVDTTNLPKPTWRTYTTVVNGVKYVHSPAPFYRVFTPIGKPIDIGSHFSYRVATAAASLGVKSRLVPRGAALSFKLSWVCAWGLESDGWVT